MIKRNIQFILVFGIMLVSSCHEQAPKARVADNALKYDTTLGIVVADTIIYEVIIKNPNPDDPWTEKCLSRLNRSALIDSIFDMVYSGTAKAYNHNTNELLTIKQVGKIEKKDNFSRNNIGMIQFTEAWYLNPASNTMTKKVLYMVLGYNFYNSEGELFGHKPVFRVEMGK
jgi:hypothetical protein